MKLLLIILATVIGSQSASDYVNRYQNIKKQQNAEADDEKLVGTGFMTTMQYSTMLTTSPSSSCPTKRFNSMTGTLTSPGYPGNYGNNLDCLYIITVPNGMHVNLSFTYFSTESGYDDLLVFDGAQFPGNNNELARLSGSRFVGGIGSYVSGTNVMGLIFHTDSSMTQGGFNATWQSFRSACGNTRFSGYQGVMQSPNWNNGRGNYPNGLTCSYTIIAPSTGYNVQVVFDARSYTEPNRDLLGFYYPNGTQIITYSGYGNRWSAVNTASGGMVMMFNSSYSTTGKGFSANYAIVPNQNQSCSCGSGNRTISNPSGQQVIVSPNYPTSNYCNKQTCVWHLYVPKMYLVAITFPHFDLERGFDTLTFYDGPTTSSKMLQYCSGTSCGNVVSSGNVLTLQFTSDSSVTRTGFEGVWSPVVG